MTDVARRHSGPNGEALSERRDPVAPDVDAAIEHVHRGIALQSQQRFDEALACYERAATLRPDDACAFYNQGTVLLALQRYDEALARFEAAIARDPRNAEAHMNRGLVLQRLRRYEDSLACYDEVVALRPGWADAYNDRGAALQNLRRHDEALASHDKAAALDPEGADAAYNQGNALLSLQRPAEALARYDRAIFLRPDHVDAHSNRGNALLNLGRYGDALASFERAAALRPAHADACYNQGVALMGLERHAEALARFDQAVSLKPDHADAWTNRGNALRNLRRGEEANASYDRSIALRPGNAWACLNKADLELGRGHFRAGWSLYESRWDLEEVRRHRRQFAQPRWRGTEALAGKTLLLHAEQGLGDTIQFCRYVPLVAALVAERGGKVVFEAPRALARLLAGLLLAGLPGGVEMVASGDPLPAFDMHCPLMSVPGVVETTVESIPARVPYLAAEAARVAYWRERLPSGGFRIGIVWQGNPTGSIDRGRSAPLASFAPLARVPGVRLISLQKHHGVDQLDRLPAGMAVETLGPDFDSGPDAFVDAAAAIMNLDLVISTDTAIVHLAGALDRPVWVALKAVPHWTWMMDREDSPWYPSARLFRQAVDGDWPNVFGRMAAELISRRRT